MTPSRTVRYVPTGVALVEAAATLFVEEAEQALAARDRFVAILAGGQTPAPVYRALATPPYRDRVDWRRVLLVPSDERLVPPDDASSNERMIRETLLAAPGPDAARYCGPPTGGADGDEAARLWEEKLRRVLGGAPSPHALADFGFLGLGADGHTASLFPGAPPPGPGRWTVATPPTGTPPVARVSLTPAFLARSGGLCFLATGEEKIAVARAIFGGAASPPAARIGDAPQTWLLGGGPD